jgi:hypothetical protein
MPRIIASLVLGLAVLCSSYAGAGELEKIIALKNLVDENEPKQKWKQIHWQKDMDAALAEAQKHGKPVLVFMLVNESGKSDANHC